MAGKNSSNEIRITRLFDAPLKTVWDAWADPAQAAHWYGPRGFTITHHSKELRAGGIWHYTMHGPDGTNYPNKVKYLEVEPYARMVYDHGGYDDRPPLFRVTAVFSEVGRKTKLDMRMTLPTPEAADETRKIIKKAGGEATWDRLAEYVEKQSKGRECFVINRSFAAPIETVYEMWTNPEHFAKWLAPAGFSMEFVKADIRAGGSTLWFMSNDAGVKMYGRAAYLELERPVRLVYTQQFCDEHEHVARHPLAPTWPETMHTVVTLAEEGPSQTRVTVEWQPHGAVTSEELAMFVKEKGGMTMGWTGSFDKLEAYLMR